MPPSYPRRSNRFPFQICVVSSKLLTMWCSLNSFPQYQDLPSWWWFRDFGAGQIYLFMSRNMLSPQGMSMLDNWWFHGTCLSVFLFWSWLWLVLVLLLVEVFWRMVWLVFCVSTCGPVVLYFAVRSVGFNSLGFRWLLCCGLDFSLLRFPPLPEIHSESNCFGDYGEAWFRNLFYSA